MMSKTLFIAYILHLISYTHAWSVVTSRPVEQPEPMLLSQEEVYNRMDQFRLNDIDVGLTALKDKKLVSCFVNDYDPLWLPAPSDRSYIIRNQPCDKVNKNTDFDTLKKKAGGKIAGMCKDLYVFWLAARHMGPPPLPGMVSQQHSSSCPYDDDLPLPPAVELPDVENVQSGKSETQMSPDRAPSMLRNGAPPMLHEGAPPMIDDGAPPMIDDGAPPMLHEGAPPMLAGGAPPMSHEGAPPMMMDGAPPMLQEGAPPLIGDGAPPMLQNGAPPMITEGEMQPPLDEKSHPRRDLDALPVAKAQPPSLSDMLKKMMKENREAADIIAPPTPDMKTPPPPQRFGRSI